MSTAHASFDKPKRSEFQFTPIKQIKAGVLDIGYYEAGPSDGSPVLLLHGFPYSIDSYIDVVPMLATRGCRVIVPYLRGHGTTRFLDSATPRSGQQAAISVDAIALMDVLQLNRAGRARKIRKHSQLRSGNSHQRNVNGFSGAMTLPRFTFKWIVR